MNQDNFMVDRKTTRVTISIDVDLYERVKATAQAENRTIALQVSQLITEAFASRDGNT